LFDGKIKLLKKYNSKIGDEFRISFKSVEDCRGFLSKTQCSLFLSTNPRDSKLGQNIEEGFLRYAQQCFKSFGKSFKYCVVLGFFCNKFEYSLFCTVTEPYTEFDLNNFFSGILKKYDQNSVLIIRAGAATLRTVAESNVYSVFNVMHVGKNINFLRDSTTFLLEGRSGIAVVSFTAEDMGIFSFASVEPLFSTSSFEMVQGMKVEEEGCLGESGEGGLFLIGSTSSRGDDPKSLQSEISKLALEKNLALEKSEDVDTDQRFYSTLCCGRGRFFIYLLIFCSLAVVIHVN
jgi:hypothetical protein